MPGTIGAHHSKATAMSPSVIYTIGHSNLGLPVFLALLTQDAIDVVVDVRSQPVSRFAPHFNRAPLAEALRSVGIRYSFMGDALGGRPDNPAYYDAEGYVRYDLWSASDQFQTGLSRLCSAANRYRIALMCSEADPANCHRQLLIARVLRNRGWLGECIVHIIPNGSHISDAEMPQQANMLEGERSWRSPQSVLHKVQRNGSSNA